MDRGPDAMIWTYFITCGLCGRKHTGKTSLNEWRRQEWGAVVGKCHSCGVKLREKFVQDVRLRYDGAPEEGE